MATPQAGNPYGKRRLSTIDLLVLMRSAVFYKVNVIYLCYKTMRRSSILSLPLQLVYPAPGLKIMPWGLYF
jgi:hypothetical protein